jgi:hypothetical protein
MTTATCRSCATSSKGNPSADDENCYKSFREEILEHRGIADTRHRPVAIDAWARLRFHDGPRATTCPLLSTPDASPYTRAASNSVESRTHDALDRLCDVCRGSIKGGDGRYRVGESEYHPDCFRFWLTAPSRREDEPPE